MVAQRSYTVPMASCFPSFANTAAACTELAQDICNFQNTLRCRSTVSAPYKRETYFAERLSQWREQEPGIDVNDSIRIDRIYAELKRDAWRDKTRFEKEDCRQLLFMLDQRHRVKRFVTKYLEKFLSIRHMLCGVPSFGIYITDSLALQLKSMFSLLQAAFTYVVRRPKLRYSFLNYNFVFRRLLDLLGRSELGLDFPPLKSRRKREDITYLWALLVKYLQWPYLNSDAQLFGAAYHTRLSTIVHRRQQSRRNASTKRQHRA